MYKRYIKRILDFLLSLIASIVLLPVMIVVAIMIRVKLGSPVIFKQQRPGKNGKIFWMYKFRTMTDERDEKGELLPDSQRMTRFGSFLRNSSLDELPELINVLKGDMSIVGPRPLLVQYLELYNESQKHRHDVRPGFTGLAQVNGRNSISWEEKFEWDLNYIKNISFMGDCRIILKTIQVVVKKDGIHSQNEATMEVFKGTPE